MKRHIFLAAALVAAFFVPKAWAQMPVFTNPLSATTAGSNASGTITASNTFQKLFSATTNAPTGRLRRGCMIQNNSADKMYVSEGMTTATASETNSFILPANGVFYCALSGVVLYGEIDIAGTSTDAFYAVQY